MTRKLRDKFNYWRTVRYLNKQSQLLAEKIREYHSNHRIYFFDVPSHSNLGDQAQYMCWLRLFSEWYPDYEIIPIPQKYSKPSTVELVKSTIRPDDLVYIHSGYLIFDPHPELLFICSVVDILRDIKVTILPQTVNLIDSHIRKFVAESFNSHSDLTLICRDDVSLEKARELFSCNLKLMPDVVTSLIGDRSYSCRNNQRSGILYCLRDDGEKYYSPEQILQLKGHFKGVRSHQCDTTINAPVWKWETQRHSLINKMITHFSQYEVIVTDRYHGTIFSQIANTPVVVISSSDHKLVSGVNWFPSEVFGNNVFFADSLDKAASIMQMILNRKGEMIINPPYFKANFYTAKL